MTTAQSLRKKYEEDLAALQEACPHERTEWLEYHLTPGHFLGMVKCCVVCEKIVNHQGVILPTTPEDKPKTTLEW